MTIEFVFKHPSGEMRVWSPTDSDINDWREQFPGLNVVEQLNSLAAWTVQNQNVKSKQRQLKTAARWIRTMLKREWEKSEAASAITRARQSLSKPQWEREGITEDQWRKRQEALFYARRQETLIETSTREIIPEIKQGLKDLVASLQAEMPDPIRWDTRISVSMQLDCPHEWRQDRYLADYRCTTCDILASQVADHEILMERMR